MSQRFKLIQKDNPRICYQTARDAFCLGRSKDCAIVIKDAHISRVQAEVRAEKNGYFIKNVGRNPLLINGSPGSERYLSDGDVLTLGKIELVFQTHKPQAQASAKGVAEEPTVVVTAPMAEAAGCRLMISAPAGGDTMAVPFDRDKLVLGRSSEADVQLNDPLISRRHCIIERRLQGVFVRNLSATNPLLINGAPETESRLYSGDRLRIGSYAIIFISNLPEDVGRSDQTAALPSPKSARAVWWVILLLVLGVGGYFGYHNAYSPWQVQRALQAARRQVDVGDLKSAQHALKTLLTKSLSAEQTRRARQMLAKTALRAAEEKNGAGDVLGAKKTLSAYLSNYGAGQEAQPLWDRMDYYCIALGKQLAAQGKNQQALHQFAAVRDESLYRVAAQKEIRRIWLNYQHQQRQEQTIVQLLKEAETHFAAKRYLTPVNRNAYAVYQAVLVLDPDHALALKRIDQIKRFYRQNGEALYKNKKWAAALGYFERYRIIDPDDKDLAAKIDTCRRRQQTARARTPVAAEDSAGRKQDHPDQQRKEIERLLESSGTESAWIMKYLFEEQQGEANTETPW